MMLVTLPFSRLERTVNKLKGKRYTGPLQTIGNHIKRKRTELGLFRKDIAALLNVDITTIANWEHNRVYPHLTCLSNIVKFLGYNPFPFETNTLGGRIKYYRLVSGLSCEQLGTILDVDPSSVYTWEANTVLPNPSSLTKVNKLIGTTTQMTSRTA